MPARRARRTSAVFECASFINCSRCAPFSSIVLATRIVASQAQLIILGFDDLRLVPLITKHYTSLKEVRRRYLGIDDQIVARLRSETNRLLRFPDAVATD